jgi:hypothetical protein
MTTGRHFGNTIKEALLIKDFYCLCHVFVCCCEDFHAENFLALQQGGWCYASRDELPSSKEQFDLPTINK